MSGARRLPGRALLAALLLTLLPVAGRGASVSVSPVLLEFESGQRALTTIVVNRGLAPMQVQVRLFRWVNGPEGEVYTETRDIGFSPPMFSLAPAEQQIVRLMLRTPAPEKQEGAYRLIIDQLPEAGVSGVQMPVRMILPVFVPPAAKGEGRLVWSAAPDGEHVVLTARNEGIRRVKLFDMARTDGGASRTIQAGLAGYVLAGETRNWRLPREAASRSIALTARTESGPLAVTVPLAPAK
ncbi:MAG TPA: fimbria/pilus periplasmic chaperone [Caulobacteraceae bacterium]|jgi:fimbrial chaperone protein